MMPAALEEVVFARGLEERDRAAPPPDFPVLPPVPAGRYTDPAFAALERHEVFERSWLFVAHEDEVADPGDFLQLDQLNAPVFLIRGQDGLVRAFFNSCQHRGAPVLTDRSGNAGRRLTCGYHAWTYGLDGSLLGIPADHDFPGLDRSCAGLRQVRSEQWGSLVFVTFDDDAPPLVDALGVVGRELGPQIGDGPDVGRVRLAERRSVDVDGNWKLTVDANVETYHVNTLHRSTAAMVIDQAATGIFLLPAGHSRMFVHDRGGPRSSGLPSFPAASALADRGIYSYHLFPNTSVVFGGSALLFLISSWPVSPDRSHYDVRFLAPGEPGEHDGQLASFIDANWAVLMEDLQTVAGTQASLRLGGLDALRLGYQERRIYHQHEELDRRIGVELVADHLRVAPLLADWIEP